MMQSALFLTIMNQCSGQTLLVNQSMSYILLVLPHGHFQHNSHHLVLVYDTCSNRGRPISLTEAFKYLIKYADVVNGQFKWHFATHPQFPLWALNTKQHHQLLSQTSDIHVTCLPIIYLYCYAIIVTLFIYINNLTAMYP